jgi:hypothetical protein
MLVAALFSAAAALAADEWNDRTVLKFSAPVMVPGAILQPGSYVFQLADANGNRNLVRITDEATGEQVVLTQAVPIKRQDTSGDVVLQFNPTSGNAPTALKAWFYPGSVYGHEFVYPEEQARQIAERTKTVVLAIDVPGSDLEKGVLRTYDASGPSATWRGDAVTMREWDAWQRTHAPALARDQQREQQQGSAAAVRADFQGMRVALDDLEKNPAKYIGQRISVDGEVKEVYGPRVFTIDEPHWGDLDGEILILLRTPLAALVRDNDRVTISGTLRPFVRTEFEREWGWFGLDPAVDTDVSAKPVLVAERLIGGDNNRALIIQVGDATRAQPTGTGGSSTTVTDPSTIAAAGMSMVGQQARLDSVRVAAMPSNGGFFITVGNRQVFVLPAQPIAVATGDTLAIDGVILQMPRSMMARLNGPAPFNQEIYIYATEVSK